MRSVVFIFIFLLNYFSLNAQTPRRALLISPNIGFGFIGGNWANLYTNPAVLGFSLYLQTEKNYLIGLGADFKYSNRLKYNPLAFIADPQGDLVGTDGRFADIRATFRAFTLPSLTFGKIIPVKMKHTDAKSGIWLAANAGWLTHYTHIADDRASVKQLRDANLGLYDNRAYGPTFGLELGLLYLRHHSVNFNVVLFSSVAFTKRRMSASEIYLLGNSQMVNQTDYLTGLKFTWVLPVYSKSDNEFYEY